MISIAVFLFAVTLAGVLSINSMLVNWNSSILGSLTVQIIPVNGVDKLKAKNETLIQEQRAAAMLEAMPEVQKVTPLNDGQLERLLKPWLGDDVDLSNLPMPRLIDVKLKKTPKSILWRWRKNWRRLRRRLRLTTTNCG